MKFRLANWKHGIWRRIFSKKVGHLSSNKIYVAFTFDTEEDCDNSKPPFYYNSYKYITCGALYQLVDGLAKRDVSATFYVTYNVARDMPEVLNYLEEWNQRIGVHVHPHNFQRIMYPYAAGKKDDNITSYNFTKKINYMKLVKDQIESVVGHKILLYRSGQLACDNETEKAAKLVGFKAISNYGGTYFMKIFRIWNLSFGWYDIFDFKEYNGLDKYIELFKSEVDQIIVFSAHPMLLYDHATDKIKEKELNTFFDFVDYLKMKDDENVEIIDQYQLLQMVEEWRRKALFGIYKIENLKAILNKFRNFVVFSLVDSTRYFYWKLFFKKL